MSYLVLVQFSEHGFLNIVVLKVAGDMLRGWLHWGMLQHFGQNEFNFQIFARCPFSDKQFPSKKTISLTVRKVQQGIPQRIYLSFPSRLALPTLLNGHPMEWARKRSTKKENDFI
jgi:hypothetical protein